MEEIASEKNQKHNHDHEGHARGVQHDNEKSIEYKRVFERKVERVRHYSIVHIDLEVLTFGFAFRK